MEIEWDRLNVSNDVTDLIRQSAEPHYLPLTTVQHHVFNHWREVAFIHILPMMKGWVIKEDQYAHLQFFEVEYTLYGGGFIRKRARVESHGRVHMQQKFVHEWMSSERKQQWLTTWSQRYLRVNVQYRTSTTGLKACLEDVGSRDPFSGRYAIG